MNAPWVLAVDIACLVGLVVVLVMLLRKKAPGRTAVVWSQELVAAQDSRGEWDVAFVKAESHVLVGVPGACPRCGSDSTCLACELPERAWGVCSGCGETWPVRLTMEEMSWLA